MFINITKRKNKKGEYSYYVYKCESKRVDRQPKTTKMYIDSFKENVILNYLDQLEFIMSVGRMFYENRKEVEQKLKDKIRVEQLDLWKLKGDYDRSFRVWEFDKENYERRGAKNDNRNQENESKSKSNAKITKTKIEEIELEQELLKSGYKTLSKKYHPDITKDDGKKMQELNQVYENLIKKV